MATEKRLIDANALIESGYDVTLDEVFPDWHDLPNSVQEAVCKHGQYLKKLINEQPTVDATPVLHGRWIVENKESIRCSECCFNRATIKMPMDYCPNCGAKMDGDGNG